MQSPSPFYSEAHEAFRATVRRFVATEIEPYAAAWDEAETFPRELYQKAGYDPAKVCSNCGKCADACSSGVPITTILHQLSVAMG